MAMDHPQALPSLDVWTSALLSKSTAGRGSNGKLEAYGIKKLRELILELAVRGKLVPQDPKDEPASALLKRIQAEKARLIAEGKIKKDKPLPQISEEEKPYALPLCWEWVRLPEIYLSISPSGSKLLSSAIKDAGTFPVVDQGQRYIAGYTDDAALLINLPGPVIVFGDHTTERKYIDFDFVAGADGVKILRPILQDEHFFFRQLQGYRLEERGYARHFKVLNDNLYALPPIEEQHRIVAKVDELMALGDQLEQQQTDSLAAHQTLVETLLGTLTRVGSQQEFSAAWTRIASHFDTLFTTEASIDQLKQTILQLAVMGKLVPQDPNDEPASVLLGKIAKEKTRLFSAGEIRKQKSLFEIGEGEKPHPLPRSWEWARFGDISYQITDGAHHTPTYVNEGIPFLSVKDMSAGRLDFSDTRFISREQHEELIKRCFPLRGDLLLTKVGTTGIPILVDTDEEFSIFVSVALIKFPLNHIHGRYLSLLVSSPLVKRQSEEGTEGIGNKNLVLRKIAAFVLAIPPLAEQHRIVAKVDELMALCDALKVRLADAQTTQLHLADAIVERAVC